MGSSHNIADSTAFGLPAVVLVFGFYDFSFERKFSIHKVPLETYMSKLCVYFLIAPSCVLIQRAIMWKTHTPTVLVDAGIVLSKRALRTSASPEAPSDQRATGRGKGKPRGSFIWLTI
jgi:hypothetical protein